MLKLRLSAERLAPYEAATTNLDAAIALYEWNMAASAAFFKVMGILEVVMRNALHDQLAARHVALARPGEWYDAAPLDSRGLKDLATARERATDNGAEPELPGKVVAELMFGFWRFLLAKRYQASLWAPALRNAFPHHPDGARLARSDVSARANRLHALRNRIAHHEPIHQRDLQQDYDALRDLVAWICPETLEWLNRISRVPVVLAARP